MAYRSTHTGPQIDAGVDLALNPDTVPTSGSDALVTSDAVATVQAGLAPFENGATSSDDYAVGDLLVRAGILYKAKTAIAVGDAFTVDTNIEVATIAEVLENFNPGPDPYTSDPEMDGTASPGSSGDFARGDHVHPSGVLTPSAAFAIPASGSSVSYDLTGLTADHELVRWNFADSGTPIAENAPPVDLTWTTAAGYFTITNNGGTTTATMKPVFALPAAIAISAHS